MIKATPGWILNLLQLLGRSRVAGKVDQAKLRTFVRLKVFKLTTSSPPFTLCLPHVTTKRSALCSSTFGVYMLLTHLLSTCKDNLHLLGCVQ